MTRRDFRLIASALSDAATATQDSKAQARGAALASRYVATALAAANPRFDRQRFLAAAEGIRD